MAPRTDSQIETSRARSRSPQRSIPRGPQNPGYNSSGLRWKERRTRDGDSRDDKSLKRGYRYDRSPRRNSRDDRDSRGSVDRDNRYRSGRDRNGLRDRDDGGDSQHNNNRENRDRGDTYRPSRRDSGRQNNRSARSPGPDPQRLNQRQDRQRDFSLNRPPNTASNFSLHGGSDSVSSAQPEKILDTSVPPPRAPPTTVAQSSEPMIVVTVNDRLGTKAQIPCQASDSIKLFKALVASKIGRQPHEIMIKRQGERPFKDVLTLADYSVSNGVQLDLELDTGD
ncbi:ubiquitin-like protein [Pseudovirgaria hyperparasitica]|uniref:Ubiquitin-like modifier HUB1 n=1 Tax=Pseudovirgaria hyperparasitica TaxID=470096 RepID=A0A6A6VUJ3_9PEZI|nr:ubiquitin-like protein [Pseudovirgaria hyperparasitica]KAF2753559.1 ubiquitin-like protein [Pseudovirgaria hyperparasitica]